MCYLECLILLRVALLPNLEQTFPTNYIMCHLIKGNKRYSHVSRHLLPCTQTPSLPPTNTQTSHSYTLLALHTQTTFPPPPPPSCTIHSLWLYLAPLKRSTDRLFLPSINVLIICGFQTLSSFNQTSTTIIISRPRPLTLFALLRRHFHCIKRSTNKPKCISQALFLTQRTQRNFITTIISSPK